MNTEPYRILIVDDSPEDREAYRRLILKGAANEYSLAEADCGEEGLRRCRSEPPDCILIDYSLPDIDGLEFLARLRAEDHGQDVPVVFLTGHGNEAVAVRAMKQGAQDYLVKGSVTAAELRHTLRNAIEKAVLRRRLERQAAILRQSRAQFRLFIEQAPISIAMFDRNMNYIAHSRRWIEDYGRGYGHLIGLNHYEVHPDIPEKWKQIHREAQAGAFLKDDNDFWIQADGSPHWLRWATYPWTDENGEIGGVIISLEEMTARRLAEESLRKSELQNKHLAIILEQSDQPFGMGYPDGRIVYANASFERLTGYTNDELMAMNWAEELTPAEWTELERAKLEELHRTGESVRYEKEYLRKDGARVPVRLLVHLITDDMGEPLQYYAFITDLTEQKKTEAALREAGRRKDEFLAMLGHELRNPLTPINNVVKLICSQPLDEAKLAWACEVIGRNVAHITQLVEDLLDVSRITQGLVKIQREPVELGRLLKYSAESVQTLIQTKRQTLNLELPSQSIYLEGDPVRLTQVFTNLLNNAAKYTGVGGRIAVGASVEGPWIAVRVRDNGMGIEPQLLLNIFDVFIQGQRGLDRSEGGLGLGLTLVKKLVELHGGQITAHSRGADQGSEFVVRLPGIVEALAPTEPLAAQELNSASDQGLRVLLIDDNRDIADSLAVWFEQIGHHVTVAYDGAQGLAAAQAQAPDVILLDIGLPDLDGYQVAKKLREQPCSQRALIIALSGYAPSKQALEAAGFDHHLIKPPKFNQLRDLIAESRRLRKSS
ncbi:MAG: response regulator [Methylomonas sp.]